MSDEFGSIVLVTLVVCFFVFLLLRELNCWYWKINRQLELLEDIGQTLSSLCKTEIHVPGNPPLVHADTMPGKLEGSVSGKEATLGGHCAICFHEIQEGKAYYCDDCKMVICYDCMLNGAKCPNCKSTLRQLTEKQITD